MAGKPHPEKALGYFAPVSEAKYIQLTTFRRDGMAVSTPVHVVADGDTAFFRTWDVSGKAKRLRHTAAVEIAPATIRGRPLGSAIRAEAHLLEGEASEQAASLLAAKHPFLHGRLIPWYHRRRGWTTQQYLLQRPATAVAPQPGSPEPL
jgi:PPOX class probable F420-dependent enzyme